MATLISLNVFLSFSLLLGGLGLWIGRRRLLTVRRLQSVATTRVYQMPGEKDEMNARLQLAAALVEKVGFWAQGSFRKDRKRSKQEEDLLCYAGWRGIHAAGLYGGVRVLLALAGALSAFLLAIHGTVSVGPMTMSIVGGLAGAYTPRMFLRGKVKKRQALIRKSLPDVLDMIIICVQAGLGLNGALERVGRERTRIPDDVIGHELKYMTFELQAGLAREQAFHNLGERNGVDDLQALAAFMVQSERLGTNLTDSLKIYAEELRTRRQQRAQEAANKASVKMLFPLVFFVFPSLFLIILGPAVMQLSESMKGLTGF